MADLGRNDPCHCGSGKKYKKCCLPKDDAEARKAHAAAEAERKKAAAEQASEEEASDGDPSKMSREANSAFAGNNAFLEKTARSKRTGAPVAGWSRSSTGNR